VGAKVLRAADKKYVFVNLNISGHTPQIRRRIASCNTFAARKTLAAHCIFIKS
jgi:hypothetical protein